MTENTAQSPHVSTRRAVKNAAEKQKFSFLYIFLLQICTLVLYILFPTIYICNICMHIPRAKLVLLRVNKKYIYYEIFSCADALNKRMWKYIRAFPAIYIFRIQRDAVKILAAADAIVCL